MPAMNLAGLTETTIVVTEYTVKLDGTPVAEGEAYPITLHGPFPDPDAADAWINSQNDSAVDVHDRYTAPMYHPNAL